MVLSNAERQKRFRERLKARAAGADLATRAREAVRSGIEASLAATVRLDMAVEFSSADEVIAYAYRPKKQAGGDPLGDLRLFFTSWAVIEEPDELTPAEREAVDLALAVLDAATLRPKLQ